MNEELNRIRNLIQRVEKFLDRRIRFLVIDDEDSCYELFVYTLPGCDIERAITGEQGLRVLEPDPLRFDCVVVDEKLPGAPGHLIIKQIRQRWSKVFTVLSTSYKFDAQTQKEIIDLKLLMTLPKGQSGPDPEGVEMLLNFILERRPQHEL